MKAKTLELNFNGQLLERGFWLYVWEIQTPKKSIFTTWDVQEIARQLMLNPRSIVWDSISVLMIRTTYSVAIRKAKTLILKLARFNSTRPHPERS